MGKKTAVISKRFDNLKRYLNRLEANRHRDERHNKKAYAEARELSAWLSVYEYGNQEMSKHAAKILERWAEDDEKSDT